MLVGEEVLATHRASGLHAQYHPLDQGGLRRKLAQHVDHRRGIDGADGSRNPARAADEKTQLPRKPDLVLMALGPMGPSIRTLGPAHIGVAPRENAGPGNLDIVV